MTEERARKPSWLKVKLPKGQAFKHVNNLVKGNSLVTVCEEAMCPNRGECWSHGTATFMACGDVCTRACGFCATRTAKPKPLDPEEPAKIADAVSRMNLSHSVVTMVTRDDLKDGAAAHMAAIIREIRKSSPQTVIEVLTSDFNGNEDALAMVMDARPHIFNHNLETVERLSPVVRFRARYRKSLHMLQRALAVIFGETREEIEQTMDDLRAHGVTVLTMGQYLRPSARHLPVIDYIRPEVFDELREVALSKGFRHVASGPLIRSSHHDANFRPELDIMEAITADLRARGELS